MKINYFIWFPIKKMYYIHNLTQFKFKTNFSDIFVVFN